MQMKPSWIKSIALVFGLVAALSLLVNWILLDRVQRANDRANKWESAYEQRNQRPPNLGDSQKSDSGTENEQLSTHSKPIPEARSDEGLLLSMQNGERNQDFSRNEIYDMLALAIENEFTELNLSDNEILELSETVMTIRESIQKLHVIERTEGNFAAFRQLENERDKAIWDFERITGLSMEEFMRRVPTEGGLDKDGSDEDKIILEYLRDYKP